LRSDIFNLFTFFPSSSPSEQAPLQFFPLLSSISTLFIFSPHSSLSLDLVNVDPYYRSRDHNCSFPTLVDSRSAMRIQRRPLRASLLLAFTISTLPQLSAAADGYALIKREPIPAATHSSTAIIGAATTLAHLDKDATIKEAPVDGKDGRPHAGPFVETAAERDRKKLKESGDDTTTGTGKKPTKGSTSTDGALPESNQGVMDDKDRFAPKDGQRGTEGGISEKSKEKAKEKKPEEPTEAPPLPHSEEKKIKGSNKATDSDEKKTKTTDSDAKSDSKTPTPPKDNKNAAAPDAAGLSKPADLPDKPHDIPHPIPVGSENSNPLKITTPASSIVSPGTATEEGAIIRPFHSFMLSFTMIIFSEIGDKTFLVAALMAMKYPPLFVFSAALPALAIMTVGSAVMGHAAPLLLPPQFTHFAAAVLFLIFGVKMLNEGRAMSPNDGVGEEMREVESELEEKEAEAARFNRRNSHAANPWALEGGRKARVNSNRLPAPPDSPPESPDGPRSRSPARSGSSFSNFTSGLQNLFSLLLSPAWVQTFVMTFLGEWGDRSQIATIAMAAGQHFWMVTFGALVGHSLCTAGAVIGGRAIAGRVSMRTVTLGGAIAFIVFGFVYLAEAFYYK